MSFVVAFGGLNCYDGEFESGVVIGSTKWIFEVKVWCSLVYVMVEFQSNAFEENHVFE